MKRFNFSLEALLELKKVLKDKLQTEYAASEEALEKALAGKAALEKMFLEEREKYEEKVKKGITAGAIQVHTVYFKELQAMIAASEYEAVQAQKIANRKREELIDSLREIKTLEKLRRKQYLDYLAEGSKQEKNTREEILAFHIAERAEEPNMRNTGTAS